MIFARVSQRAWRAVPRSAFPRGGGGSSFLAAVLPGPAYLVSGANTVTWGFPVTVCLVAAVCRNFGRAFWARCE